MLSRILVLLFGVCFVAIIIPGCSRGNSNPTQSDLDKLMQEMKTQPDGNRTVLGIWRIHLNREYQSIRIEPVARMNEAHVKNPNPLDIQVCEEGSIRYSGWFPCWDFNIVLTNNGAGNIYYYDVRGIVLLDNFSKGLYNADGLTTLYGYVGPQRNPFKAFGDSPPFLSREENFQVKVSKDYEGQKDPDDIVLTMIIDASTDSHCQEPYKITNFWQPTIPLESSITTAVIEIVDWQDDIIDIQMTAPEIPGFQFFGWDHPYGTSDYFLIFQHGGLEREGIFTGTVRAISNVQNPHPESNPEDLYANVRIRIGDFDFLLDYWFTPATSTAELDEITDEWDERDHTVYNWQQVPNKPGFQNPLNLNGATYTLYSHTMYQGPGSPLTHYGSVRVPDGIPPGEKLPVFVYTHHGDYVNSVVDCNFNFPGFIQEPLGCEGELKNQFIQVSPSYRGNRLFWTNVFDPFISGVFKVDNSPADWDVDDVLTFLEGVLQNVPEADPTRVVIFGGSRGAAPAIMAKLRDGLSGNHRLGGVIAQFATATDFLLPQIKESVKRYIEYEYYHQTTPITPETHYYNEDYCVIERVLNWYLNEIGDKEENKIEGRKKLLRSSPVYYTNGVELICIQNHFGMLDELVRIDHTLRLQMKFSHIPPMPPFFLYQFWYYPDQPHCPAHDSIPFETDKNYWELMEDLLLFWVN